MTKETKQILMFLVGQAVGENLRTFREAGNTPKTLAHYQKTCKILYNATTELIDL